MFRRCRAKLKTYQTVSMAHLGQVAVSVSGCHVASPKLWMPPPPGAKRITLKKRDEVLSARQQYGPAVTASRAAEADPDTIDRQQIGRTLEYTRRKAPTMEKVVGKVETIAAGGGVRTRGATKAPVPSATLRISAGQAIGVTFEEAAAGPHGAARGAVIGRRGAIGGAADVSGSFRSGDAVLSITFGGVENDCRRLRLSEVTAERTATTDASGATEWMYALEQDEAGDG